MPPRPFPFQIGVGTDIIHIDRVRNILLKAEGSSTKVNSFLRRFLTRYEQDAFRQQYRHWDLTSAKGIDVVSKHLAGRWAAKEATVKAVTWRKLNFHEIVIRRPRYGGGMHAVILDKPASKTMPSVRRLNLSDPGTQGVQGHRNKSADDHSGRASNPLHDEALGLKSASYVSTTSGQLHPGTTEPAQVSTQDADNIQDHTAVDERDHDLSGQIAQISISHDGEYATAVCIAAQDAMEGDVGGEAAARDHL